MVAHHMQKRPGNQHREEGEALPSSQWWGLANQQDEQLLNCRWLLPGRTRAQPRISIFGSSLKEAKNPNARETS